MNPRLTELRERILHLEAQIEYELRQRRAELHADFEHRRVHFEQAVLAQQRRFRKGLPRYLADAEWRNVITAPVIYPVLLALLAVDLAVTLYPWICFPLYRIPRVRRRDHIVFDRAHLGDLNLIEKLNCAYCSYANGLVGCLREVVARTEQYGCPIKHARRTRDAHPHDLRFADYGDAEAYRRELLALREQLQTLADPRVT